MCDSSVIEAIEVDEIVSFSSSSQIILFDYFKLLAYLIYYSVLDQFTSKILLVIWDVKSARSFDHKTRLDP